MNSTTHKHTNQLINESSPYLLQHAHNPVNWYPWGNEALEKAKQENKLIIVSIGYAACHWCHVMEHESFENETIANFMNEHFVSIKVDREERPDIDQVYMNAVQLLTGKGGWPLNCITLADGRPIYGGTYFPSDQWLDVLTQVLNFTKEQPTKTLQQAISLTESIQNSELMVQNANKEEYSLEELKLIFERLISQFDKENGGQKGAPKFPMPVGQQFLLQYYAVSTNEKAKFAVLQTLNKMANGGIYDQIGGGFARYTTDKYWKVPHFEKMLYDNAQLVSLYSAAFQLTKHELYKTIVKETLDFVQRELMRTEGGFYSSLDADSEGVEGKFYVWTEDEMVETLGENADLIADYYNVSANGNWENGVNILFISEDDKFLLKKQDSTIEELDRKILEAKKSLLERRNRRIRPALDDKILTAWNGLLIKAFADAYKVFNEPTYLELALKNADFILLSLKTDEHCLYRNFKNNKASINGFMDDYAFIIEAFISLYQATFNEKWLNEALKLTEYCFIHFYDVNSGMFFYTSDLDPALIARKMELSDNVIPASNSTMAKNLFVLGHYFYKEELIDKARIMLSNVKQDIMNYGIYGANWHILMSWFAVAPFEVVIIGKDAERMRSELESYYLPNIIIAGGSTEAKLPLMEGKTAENETLIYICRNKACYRPFETVTEAVDLIKNMMKNDR